MNLKKSYNDEIAFYQDMYNQIGGISTRIG